LAIVHVVMKSSSTAPPAAAHAQYIARDGQYQQRGGLELVESGNMPEFARENPHSFWEAADAFERKNGRAYTELQIALPRELAPEQRHELARETTRELLGERFAYTLAVHTPLAKDNIEQPHMHLMFSERVVDSNIEQPHMHLMFSERVVDSNTQSLSQEQFFKRNGAKKDPEWNSRDKPMEVREKWVEMMNAAMERHGHIQDSAQRLDARSWADQGRPDLAELREEKTLRGNGPEAMERHREIDGLRAQRAELPAPHLSADKVIELWERAAEQQIAQVQEREARELSRLDKLIAAAREFAHEVKDRTVAFAKDIKERAGSLFGNAPQEEQAKAAPEKDQAQEQARPPTPEMQARLDELLGGFHRRMEAQQSVEAKLADFGNRMDTRLQQEQAQALARQQQEQALKQQQEQTKTKEPEIEREHSRGFGIGR
jgi:MobA/MobL family